MHPDLKIHPTRFLTPLNWPTVMAEDPLKPNHRETLDFNLIIMRRFFAAIFFFLYYSR